MYGKQVTRGTVHNRGAIDHTRFFSRASRTEEPNISHKWPSGRGRGYGKRQPCLRVDLGSSRIIKKKKEL